MVVIGAMHGSFKDRKTGEDISYAKLYVTYPFDSPDDKIPDGCMGQRCEAMSVPLDALNGVKVGDEIVPVYNKYGRVLAIQFTQKKSA